MPRNLDTFGSQGEVFYRAGAIMDRSDFLKYLAHTKVNK